MAFRIPNLTSSMVNKVTGILITPWNLFFQQFTNKAAPIEIITVGTSPFSVTQNDIGNFVIYDGNVSLIELIRGTDAITLYTDTTSPRLVPIALGDTLRVTYTVLRPIIKFIPTWG